MEFDTDIVDGTVYSFIVSFSQDLSPHYNNPDKVLIKGQVGSMSGVLSLLSNYTDMSPLEQGQFLSKLKKRSSEYAVSQMNNMYYRVMVYEEKLTATT